MHISAPSPAAAPISATPVTHPHPVARLIADTLAAADAAEAAALGFARGLVSVEALILASDRAFHAWRRAGAHAAAVWDAAGTDDRPPLSAELERASDRARRAYRAGFRG